MTEWKKKLFEEFRICTRLNILFYDGYDKLKYQCVENMNETDQQKLNKVAKRAIGELLQQESREKKYKSVYFDKEKALYCTAFYFEESLPEFGKIVLGPYTRVAKEDENIPFLPHFAVEKMVDFFHEFVKQYSVRKKMYNLFDEHGSYHFVRIARYVEDNINQNISLESVANHIKLSKPYICNIVKETTNYTVSQFITRTKMNKAKILFWNGFEDIHEVSLILGYKSQSYFSRRFKLMEGMSPTKYIQSLHDKV